MRGFFSSDRPLRFSHVVPLGLSCRVTYQVRRYFRSASAYPFDWWISPLAGLASYLADPDPERIYGEKALAERTLDGAVSTIYVPELGFELFHEFPRCRAAGDPGQVAPVAPGWREHVAAARAKHTQRLERLLGLDRAGNRVLFVRHKLDLEPASGDPGRAIAALQEALAARFAAAQVHLLLVNVPAPVELGPRSQSLSFEDPPGPPPEAWRGEESRWAAAFAAAGFRPCRSFGAPRAACGPPD